MKKENGITILALLVTITVMLILAGITLGTMNNSDESLIDKTNQEAMSAKRESIIEKIEADLYTEKVKTGKKPNKEKLKQIIKDYGTINNDADSFTTSDGIEIQFNEIVGWEN